MQDSITLSVHPQFPQIKANIEVVQDEELFAVDGLEANLHISYVGDGMRYQAIVEYRFELIDQRDVQSTILVENELVIDTTASTMIEDMNRAFGYTVVTSSNVAKFTSNNILFEEEIPLLLESTGIAVKAKFEAQ